MENFVRTTMDVDGRIETRLRASVMLHYPHDDSTRLTRPVLEMHNSRRRPWHITADHAITDADDDSIMLEGEVHIWRNGDSGMREVELVTTDLRVEPDSNYAETADPATIITSSAVTKGIGMRAYLAEDRLELLHEVKTRYETRSNNQEHPWQKEKVL